MFAKLKTAYNGLKLLLYEFATHPNVPNLPAVIMDIQQLSKQLSKQLAENQNRLAENQNRLAENQNRLAENQNRLAENQNRLAENQNRLAENQNRLAGRLADREIETVKKMLYEVLGREKPTDAECEIVSDYKVAYDSPDHIVPRGTRNDNSVWHGFNEKLYLFMKGKSPLRVLDLGCAGGGFVESLVEDGHDAFGIEGSNYSLIGKRAAWRTLPARLFTGDITKPFTLTKKGRNEPIQFDVITAWELMEHFKEEDIRQVFENIRKHLADDGYFMCSVATFVDYDPSTGAVFHQTVQPKEWWAEQFEKAGFSVVEQNIIGKDDWLRGSGNLGKDIDWHEDEGKGFHLVLNKSSNYLTGR